MSESRPKSLSALVEQEREVETSELWGGEFADTFPTLSSDQFEAVQKAIEDESGEGSIHVVADD